MTINAVIPTRHDFTGNDVNETFSYTLKIADGSHIKLVHTDTDGVENALADPLVEDTDYTVNGVGDAGGGSVTFPKAGSVYSTLASGEKFSVLYDFPIEQTTDLPNTGRVFNEEVEDQLDYMTVLINQGEEKFDRSIKLVEGSVLTDISFPEGADAAARKNKAIAWNEDSDALELASSIGTNRGDWATATAYDARDIVKDTTNGSIYWCNTSHTSSGSLPISSNADVAKWDLLIDGSTITDTAAAVAFQYTFDDSTSMADPGTGDIRFDNATVASVTNIAIDATSADTGNPDVSDFIASIDDGTNTIHEAYITIRKSGTPATFAIFSVTGSIVDNTGWLQIPVTYVASNGSWTAADVTYVSFARSGNKGTPSGLDMAFESNTNDADQGTGKLWLNNATPASATVVYVDDVDANGTNINSYVDSWDDSSSTIKGEIAIFKQADPAVFALYNVTGAVTSASTYSKVAVTYVTGAGSFSDTDPIQVAFTRAGDKGDNGSLVNVVEDTAPQLGGALDTNSKAIDESEGSSVASAATADIWATDGNTVHITGTTTITSFGTASRAGAWRKVIFDGALTLTDGANLNLPGSANITTAANDFAFVFADTTTLFRVLYFKANGEPAANVVQIVNVIDSGMSTHTTTVPIDNTIPQNDEGEEVMTLAITPKSSSHKLVITVNVQGSNSTQDEVVVALFQDSTADAIACVAGWQQNATQCQSISFTHYMPAGTTSETTFKVRVGGDSGTFTFNGESGGALYGGTLSSSITITEKI